MAAVLVRLRRRRRPVAGGRGRPRRRWRRTVRGRRPRRLLLLYDGRRRRRGRFRRGGPFGRVFRAPTLLRGLRTDAGAAWFVVLLVLSLVVFQLGGRLEVRDAVLARVRRLARVRLQVPAQVGHLHEEPIAVRTPERFLASVQPHVRLQMVVPREALLAHRAHERFLAGVRALVVLQHVLVPELFAAHGALERPALALLAGRRGGSAADARDGRRVGRRGGRRDGRRLVVRSRGRRRRRRSRSKQRGGRLVVVPAVQPVRVQVEHLVHDLQQDNVRGRGGRFQLLLLLRADRTGVLQPLVRVHEQRAQFLFVPGQLVDVVPFQERVQRIVYSVVVYISFKNKQRNPIKNNVSGVFRQRIRPQRTNGRIVFIPYGYVKYSRGNIRVADKR